MKIDIKILLVTLLTFFSGILYSQENDTLVSSNWRYDSILSSDAFFLDILFYKQQNDVLLNNLGPFGSPSYTPTTFGIVSNERFYLNKKVKKALFHLEGIKPFTNISYINASRKEQVFSVNHFQRFGKLILFSFDYTKLSSPGSYLNQEANNTFFDVAIDYTSKKSIYKVTFSTFIKRIFLEENGGLATPTDFENNLYDNRLTYNVNLEQSNSSRKNYEFNLNQRLKLLSFSNDTIVENGLYLKWHSKYLSDTYVFNENDPFSPIYKTVFIDSTTSVDSIFQQNFSNTLLFNYVKGTLDLSLFTGYELNNYLQSYGLDTSYNDVYVGTQFDKKGVELDTDFSVKYAVSGYRRGDVDAVFNINYLFNKNIEIELHSDYHLNEANLRLVNYYSNHFAWMNYNFNKQSVVFNQLKVNLKKIKTQITLENKVFKDYIFFNLDAQPSQNNSINSISTFKVSKNYKLFNFYFRSVVIYQMTSNEVLFPLPEFIGRQLIYYENYLFKKALKFQIGGNISFKTEYFGYAYMPATNQFYTQNNTRIGNYPYFDIFINTKLKRAQIFFKYEHFNAGWTDYTYYSAPNYPRLDKSFKFGISWNMFD